MPDEQKSGSRPLSFPRQGPSAASDWEAQALFEGTIDFWTVWPNKKINK